MHTLSNIMTKHLFALAAAVLLAVASAPAGAQIVVEPINPVLRSRPVDDQQGLPSIQLPGGQQDAPRQVAEWAVAKAMVSGSLSRISNDGHRATVQVMVAGRGRCKVDLVLAERMGWEQSGTEWRVAQLVCP